MSQFYLGFRAKGGGEVNAIDFGCFSPCISLIFCNFYSFFANSSFVSEREGDLVAGLSESEPEVESTEIAIDNPADSKPASPVCESGQVTRMLARTIATTSKGSKTVSAASQADITAAYLNGELTFSGRF